jgi:hypothetical protein
MIPVCCVLLVFSFAENKTSCVYDVIPQNEIICACIAVFHFLSTCSKQLKAYSRGAALLSHWLLHCGSIDNTLLSRRFFQYNRPINDRNRSCLLHSHKRTGHPLFSVYCTVCSWRDVASEWVFCSNSILFEASTDLATFWPQTSIEYAKQWRISSPSRPSDHHRLIVMCMRRCSSLLGARCGHNRP